MEHRESVSPRGLLRWPYVVALVALVLNDHVFKGSGWLPGWVTGKLSDVAGLFLAPAVLAALLQVETRRAVWGCAAATALVFSALELSPQFVAVWETASQLLGVPWRVTMDATDLLTVPMVVPGVWCFRARRCTPPFGERALLATALVACAASSPVDDVRDTNQNAPVIVNSGAMALELRVHTLRSELQVDCGSIRAQAGSALPTSAFVVTRVDQLQPHGSSSLPVAGAACSLVMLSVSGFPPKLVRWDGSRLDPMSVPATLSDAQLEAARQDERFVFVEVTEGELRFDSAGEWLVDFAPDYELAAECAPAPKALPWTEFPAYDAWLSVVRVEAQGDDCFSLVVEPKPSPAPSAPSAVAPGASTLPSYPSGASPSAPRPVSDSEEALDVNSERPPEDTTTSEELGEDLDAGTPDSGTDSSDVRVDDAGARSAWEGDAGASDAGGGPVGLESLAWRALGAEPVAVQLCVPERALRVAAGDAIVVERRDRTLTVENPVRGVTLTLFADVPLPYRVFSAELHEGVAHEGCELQPEERPTRVSRPTSVEVLAPSGSASLAPGERRWFKSESSALLVGLLDARESVLGASIGAAVYGYALRESKRDADAGD